MAMANGLGGGRADRRTAFGVALTLAWVAIGSFYVGRSVGWIRRPTGTNRFCSFQYGLNPTACSSSRCGGASFEGRVLNTINCLPA